MVLGDDDRSHASGHSRGHLGRSRGCQIHGQVMTQGMTHILQQPPEAPGVVWWPHLDMLNAMLKGIHSDLREAIHYDRLRRCGFLEATGDV